MRQSAVVLVLFASLAAQGDEPKQPAGPWRYYVVSLRGGGGTRPYMEPLLNDMSEDGWEFHQGIPFSDKDGPSFVELVFRRRLSEKERADFDTELRRLEGAWVLASIDDGKQKQKGDGKVRLEVKSRTWELIPAVRGEEPLRALSGTAKLVNVTGKTLSMHHGQGCWSLCKVEGERLHVCFQAWGRSRPAGFAGEDGRFVYTVWDRKKE